MAQLYADENFDYRVVAELRQRGQDVLTAQEAGQAGQKIPDADVLAFAVLQNRAVLTFNRRDFIRIHNSGQPHCGIIVCTDDKDVAALATRIHHALLNSPALKNQLLRIYRPRTP
jgi:predicted nuclease of predicted toxin-antitoxin system